jgi:hypothetical protein
MATTGDLVSIKLIANRLYRNPIMKEMTYEFIVDNAIEVLRIIDAPSLYVKMREVINVVNYRASKPVNMMNIEGIARVDRGSVEALVPSDHISHEFYGKGGESPKRTGGTYSLNSRYINLNFEKGTVEVIYKTLAVDEECYPLVLNDPALIRAVESYIKYKWFDILNDMDKISDRKLNKVEVEYLFNVGQATADLIMPNADELEAITNTIVQLIPSGNEFSKRFEFLGEKELLRIN